MTHAIDDFLEQQGLTSQAYAKIIEKDPSYITHLRKGKVTPKLMTMMKIFITSNCQINIADIVPISTLKEHNLLKHDGSCIVKLTLS